MEYRLIFADNTEIGCDICGKAHGMDVLYMQVEPMTVAQAAAIFDDVSKTRRMVFDTGNFQDVFEGYTSVRSIKRSSDVTEVMMEAEGNEEE